VAVSRCTVKTLLIFEEISMNFIIWLVVGGLIGWVASKIMNTDAQQGIFLNIVVGIVGSMLGGWLVAPLLGSGTVNQNDFSIMGLLSSLIGALSIVRPTRSASGTRIVRTAKSPQDPLPWQRLLGAFLVLVPEAGIEPARLAAGDFLTTSTFAAPVTGSWSGARLHLSLSTLGARRLLSTPSPGLSIRGLARY
jgi:uncharacterized membrane protein YeaQ/YmgE (transglycosylase-associated protein family)